MQELERAVPEHFMTITTGYRFPEESIRDLRPGEGDGTRLLSVGPNCLLEALTAF
jgi:hypothetical protein